MFTRNNQVDNRVFAIAAQALKKHSGLGAERVSTVRTQEARRRDVVAKAKQYSAPESRSEVRVYLKPLSNCTKVLVPSLRVFRRGTFAGQIRRPNLLLLLCLQDPNALKARYAKLQNGSDIRGVALE
eukprot:4798675-Pyramimonas_sp.AAC.1